MADEKTIIEFDIEYGDSVKQTEVLTKNLLDLRKEVTANKDSQKALKKAGGDTAKGLRELQIAELALKDKLSEANRERKKAVDITKIQANTLEGLRKQTKSLFAEREKLNTSTKKGSKRFDELTKKLKQNNDAIQKVDKASGSYTSSIGHYGDALKGVSPRMGGFVMQLQTAKAGLLSAKAGLLANVKSLGVFKIALISTGIGALLVALGALITFFTRSQKGMDKVSVAMEYAGAIVAELMDRVSSLGETLFNAISEPQKLWEGFVDFLKNQLTTRVEGVIQIFSGLGTVIEGLLDFDWDKMKEGAGEAGDAVIKIGTGFSSDDIIDGFNAVTESIVELGSQALKEADAMGDLERQSQALRDSQIGFITEEAKIRRDIAELRLKVKDVNLTDQERLVSLKEAIALEDEMFAQKQKLVVEEARISQLRTDMGLSTSEELRTNAELQAKIFATEEESTKRKLRLASELLTFENKVNTKNIKAKENLTQIFIEQNNLMEQSQAESELKRLEGTSEFYDKKKDLLQTDHDNELAGIEEKKDLLLENDALTNDERTLIEEESKLAKLEAELEFNDEFNELKTEQNDFEIDAEKTKNEKIADDNAKLQNDLISGAKGTSSILFNALGASLKNEETRINTSYDKQQKALDKKLKDGSISQEQFDKQSKQLEKNKAQELYKIELAQFKQKKMQALANIAIDVASAVTKIWGQTGIGAIALQALPIIAGVVQAGIVLNQPAPQPPSFAEGGEVKSFLIGGNSHEAGGTTYSGSDGSSFIAEKDEAMFITKKGDSTLEALAHINSLNGGRGLDNASQYYADGGSVVTSGNDTSQIKTIIEETLRNVQIVTQVQDIQTGLTDFNEVLNAGVI